VPVNSSGVSPDETLYQGGSLPVYARAKGMLDPMIYRKGRQIRWPGDFGGIREGKIDEMEYAFPAFRDTADSICGKKQVYYDYAWPYPLLLPYSSYASPYYYPPLPTPYAPRGDGLSLLAASVGKTGLIAVGVDGSGNRPCPA